MHRGIMPCTCAGPNGGKAGADNKLGFRSLLTKFRVMSGHHS